MHVPWDAFYKQVMKRYFQSQQITSVETEVEVGRLPRTIDLTFVCSEQDAQRLEQTTAFTFLRQHNLIEFKSPSDPLTVAEYERIIARAYIYMAEEGIDDLSSIAVYALTSGMPRKVLHNVPQLVKFSHPSQALYKSDDKLPFHVLPVPDLAISDERNYPLLLFSKGKKRKAFLRELFRKGAMDYLRIAYQLYPEEVMEVFSVRNEFPPIEENAKVIVKDLGAEVLLRAMDRQTLAQVSDEQKEILLRVLLEQLFGTEKADAILRDNSRAS